MLEGIAGGISPWWHIIGSAQEDKRIFGLHQPVLEWHKKNEEYLYNRLPVANVGLVWSQDNVEYGGGLLEKDQVQDAWRGAVMALTRAGIPFLPVNAHDLEEQNAGMDLLILPALAVISDEQAKALEAFVERGGSVFAAGETGIFDAEGEERPVSRLGNLFGFRFSAARNETAAAASWENPVLHNYLRIDAAESPLFAGFGNTAIIPMGGVYREIIPQGNAKTLASYIPPFPMYPPEFVWTAVPGTDKPVIIECRKDRGGRAIYAAWDINAVYGKAALPDHGSLVGNIVKYLLGNKLPVHVECGAYIDFKVYRQENRLIIHLINGNHTGFAQGYAENNLPVGPVKIRVQVPGFAPSRVRTTVEGAEAVMTEEGGGVFTIRLDRLEVHQLILVE
jgi:hypothetical protein